jgi:hypothetical protein
MMERLRDTQTFGSDDEAEAARLLRLLGPAMPAPGLERRVYANLGVRRRYGPRAVRIISAASTPLAIMAVAGLALAMYVRHGGTAPGPTRSAPAAPPARISQMTTERDANEVSPAPEEEVPPKLAPSGTSLDSPNTPRTRPRSAPCVEPSPAPGALQTSSREPTRSASSAAQVEDTRPPAAEPADSSEAFLAAAPPEEAALVLAGLRALRREHNPSRAGTLLARYLQSSPRGVLAQEALAIAIEAGLARGDREAAARLGEQYLERFPTGRFVRVARKATDPTRP